jgi:putative transposase
MKRPPYPDDITDKEWALIEPTLYNTEPSGRKPKYERREVMNAIFYLVRTGCSWRHLPHEFPPWNVVYTQFTRWRDRGVFEKMHDKVKERVRESLGRNAKASAGIIDSQSVKTTEKGAPKGMMQVRKLKDAKGILQSTRKGSCYRRMLRVQK